MRHCQRLQVKTNLRLLLSAEVKPTEDKEEEIEVKEGIEAAVVEGDNSLQHDHEVLGIHPRLQSLVVIGIMSMAIKLSTV